MRPPKQKQPQVKKGLCRVLEHVDVDVDVEYRMSRRSVKTGHLQWQNLKSLFLKSLSRILVKYVPICSIRTPI